MDRFQKLQIQQLDNKLIPLKDIAVPGKGWINTIRITLKMTFLQLAKRANTKPQVVQSFEKNEIKGTITLNSLNKIAEAMDCKLVYAIVPNNSLKYIIENQAQIIAEKIVNNVAHSMRLEGVDVKDEFIKEQIEETKTELILGSTKKLWSYEF